MEGKHSIVDDTGLNGVRFYCGGPSVVEDDEGHSVTKWENVTSTVAIFGNWGHILNCTTYSIGFDLQVQEPQGKYKVGLTGSKYK